MLLFGLKFVTRDTHRSDQMLYYYSFSRKTINWWEKLFFHLFDLAMVNSNILHNKIKQDKNLTGDVL
jgi:hypothetical protein